MRHVPSTDKLVLEMITLLDALREDKQKSNANAVLLKTGDVLGALEVFTFANFTDSEQEVIFSRARTRIEPIDEESPKTPRDGHG